MTSTDTSTGAPAKRPTIKMVAARAGVSVATVSYVLSGRSDRKNAPRPDTAERVHRAVAELGYRRNEAARSIRTGASGFAVLALTMLSDPWALDLVEASQSAFAPSGITPLVLGDADWRNFVGRHSPDVVFIDDVPRDPTQRAEHLDQLKTLAAQGHKFVVLAEDIEPDGFDVVRSSAFPGCDEAMRYLLARHDRVGCLTMGTSLTAQRGRYRTRYSAFHHGMREAGLPINPAWVEECERDSVSAYAAALRLLSQPDRPDAIFAVTDFVGVAAMQAAHALHLKVGRDIAIMGVGNTTLGGRLSPSLSSVGPEAFFSTLAGHLAARAQQSDLGSGTLLDFTWRVIERDSTLSA